MKEVAVITSGFAPVPAVGGGAVEELTTILIKENENHEFYNFNIYTIADKRLDNLSFRHSRLIQIHVSKFEYYIEKVINSLIRRLKIKKSFTVYNVKLNRLLTKDVPKYEIIIDENLMDIVFKQSKIMQGKKIFLHLHNDLNTTSKTIEMAKVFNDLNATTLSVSNYIRESLISKSNYQEAKCKLLYNCIDYNYYFAYQAADAKSLRKKINIDEKDFVFLFVGRLNEEKGIYELIKAFSKNKNPNIKLIICGGTWGESFIDNKFTRLLYSTLGQQIVNTRFVGYVKPENLLDYYKLADCVVIPSSVQESFGMVMLESGLFGKTIIATRSGGMPEILSDNSAIYVNLDYDLSNNLYKKMEWCYQNPEKSKLFGIKAREEILKKSQFDQKNYFDNFSSIIENS